MSDSRRVKFSSSPTPRSILKQSEPHPRDSGVGSSSSDHTGSSGSLDERFTARDYDIQSNNVDALREALTDAIKDINHWKTKFEKKHSEQVETRRKLRHAEARYEEAFENNQLLEVRVNSLNDRMEKQDTALDIANAKIADLDGELSEWKDNCQTLGGELSEWKDNYQRLDDLYQSVKHSASGSVVSGGSGEHSLVLGPTRSHRDKKDGTEMTSRMKERINRDQTDSSSSQATTRSSRSTEATTSSKRANHRAAPAASDSSKPYIEPMPPRVSNSSSNNNTLASPRQRGTYTLTTAERRREAPGPSSSSSSRRYSRHGEQGDYIAHPLPERRSS
ncbi:hypothetical protein SAMD00023353_0503190 [Rosellinia necatrix]|uniref:Uncharacterized protein n=1 Tax=Rosellinia necatrix TaxID=77044 RepID=A0A1S7UKT5_ROSNE|nr:hypothetical protein SAMD00023353_0503190 [Rosellinia necatrix]